LEQSGELDVANTKALQRLPEADDVSNILLCFQGNQNKSKKNSSLGKKSAPITPLSAAYVLPEARNKLKTLLQATGSYVRGTDSIEVSNRVANGFVFKLESIQATPRSWKKLWEVFIAMCTFKPLKHIGHCI
jgi:hypothetical protein